MDGYLRRLAECKVDRHEFNLNLDSDPKITLPGLKRVPGTSAVEPSVQLSAGCRASLYDAIREMGAYGSVVEEEEHRKDRDGLLHNPRGG